MGYVGSPYAPRCPPSGSRSRKSSPSAVWIPVFMIKRDYRSDSVPGRVYENIKKQVEAMAIDISDVHIIDRQAGIVGRSRRDKRHVNRRRKLATLEYPPSVAKVAACGYRSSTAGQVLILLKSQSFKFLDPVVCRLVVGVVSIIGPWRR